MIKRQTSFPQPKVTDSQVSYKDQGTVKYAKAETIATPTKSAPYGAGEMRGGGAALRGKKFSGNLLVFTGGQFGQLQGSSGPTPPSLEEVLSQRGFDAPAMQTGMQNAMQSMFKDPITGEYRTGGQHAANHANAMSKFYSQNPEALEIAKQYNTDPTQFGGKPPQIRTRGPESLATQGRSMQQPQQRGGMFNQQNQFGGQQGQQGMQQMMQFMQQMMQMFSMMSGQNRSGGFGGGFGGQQQYQKPQRYQPQQYQPPPRQQFQPVQQQYGQMGPQQPSPFAQSIRPRY